MQTALETILCHDELTEDERCKLETRAPCRVHELRTGSQHASLIALLSGYDISKCERFHDRVYGLHAPSQLMEIVFRSITHLTNSNSFSRPFDFAAIRGLTSPKNLSYSSSQEQLAKLRIDPQWLINAAFSMRVVEDIECRALISSFAIVATSDLEYSRRSLLECQQCYRRALESSKLSKTMRRKSTFCARFSDWSSRIAKPQ